ncbi:glycosyltransferase 61 family protein [Methylobacterium organophilum]|uniref:Glycosyltransferase 61 catalytic domain-containing protein n=1 Tax=Methylobacterium organophilum TaxID=410 RepID=A0ABQ4TBH6_METOR|nr:glycosyltransferase 61 family protein [Methylobacterium organophilum]GJE28583.1 hypothetical protein LKMONMHP_3455 [Methylobacterium organophilum]
MTFHAHVVQDMRSLDLFLADVQDGFVELTQYGPLSDTFDGRFPRLYRFHGGMITTYGVIQGEAFCPDTTFYDLYPMKEEFDYVNKEIAANLKHDHLLREDQAGAIFCTHIWDKNYQHFLVEIFPRIWAVCQIEALRHLPIVTSDHGHVREILETCFPDRTFIYLKHGEAVRVAGPVYYPGAMARNMSTPPAVLGQALRFFRMQVLFKAGIDPEERPSRGRTIFFGRKPNMNYQGNQRVLLNFAELEEAFDEIGIPIRDFDSKSLTEKATEAQGVSMAVSLTGANMMNLIFLPLSASMFIIEHPVFKGSYFFPLLYRAIGFDLTYFFAFHQTKLAEPESRIENAEYIIDAPAFTENLRESLFVTGDRRLGKNIMLNGGFDSLLETGFAQGLAESTSGRLENISFETANFGLAGWISRTFRARQTEQDLVILDYYTSDCNGNVEQILRDMPLVLDSLPRAVRPVVLLWPDKAAMTQPDPATLHAYRTICQASEACLIDCRPLIIRVMHSCGKSSIDEMFMDDTHLHPYFAKMAGALIAAHIDLFLTSGRRRSALRVRKPIKVAVAQPDQPWPQPSSVPLALYEASEHGILLGMMMETGLADLEIVVSGEVRQRVLSTPRKNSAASASHYVPVTGVTFRKGERIAFRPVTDSPGAGEVQSLLVQAIGEEA